MKGKSSLPPAFTVPKVEGQRNEDRYQRSSKGVFALSDGASISFDSAAWARIFSTMLGVRILDENRLIQVLAIGDSLAVLCDGDRIKCTFPYSTALQFEQSPQLLCTNLAENAFLNNADRSDELYADWTFGGLEQPALLCMTDALGQWLLSWKEPDQSAIAILRNIRTQGEFARFVRTERKAGRLRRDDTTLIALWVAP